MSIRIVQPMADHPNPGVSLEFFVMESLLEKAVVHSPFILKCETERGYERWLPRPSQSKGIPVN